MEEKYEVSSMDTNSNEKECIIFDEWFEAPDELNEFCKSIGYENPDYGNFDLMFDNRVVNFCKERLSRLWNDYVYKGKESFKFRIGFSGCGYLRTVDISKQWTLEYNNVDAPIIRYVNSTANKYGFTRLKKNNLKGN